MIKRPIILLFFIVVLGFLLRVVHLDKYPPAVSWDEVSHGYNAYSILKTGRDEWGQKFPVINFRAYGDYPLPLNLYITAPSIIVFGLSEFSIRLPHALLGTLSIFATYFLVLGLTKHKGVSLLASFLMAIEPWSLFTSRVVLQQNVSIFFTISAAAAFFNREKGRFLLPASLIFLFLSLFAYHSTRIFSPLIVVVALLIYKQEVLRLLKKEARISALFVVAISVFLTISSIIVLQPSARARSQWLFIINQSAVNQIIEKRENSNLPPFVTRILYNRPTYFIGRFVKNYTGYFSPPFLFLKGGTQYQYSLPDKGLSYLINLPLFYLGIVIFLKKAISGRKDYKLLVAWLFLSSVPASITNETFAVTRASTMLPLPQIASSTGALWLFEYLRKKYFGRYRYLLAIFYFVSTFILLEDYLNNYFTNYSKNYSQAWQYGYKQAVSFIKENYEDYDKIIVTKKYGEPHEFVLFFWPWDPQKYRSDPNLIHFYQSNWYWVDAFDKFYFVNDWQINEKGTGNYEFNLESGRSVSCTGNSTRCLLVTSPGNVPEGWKKLEIIYFLNGEPAFEIFEN